MQILLIGGVPSSGSTWLVHLLSQNKLFFCLPETGLFTQGKVFCLEDTASGGLNSQVPWIDIAAKTRSALGWVIDVSNAKGSQFSPIKFLSNKISTIVNTNQIVVEKTPENIFAFKYYLQEKKDRQVVVTFRKLEEVCASLMRRGFSKIESILIWFAHALEIFRICKEYPERVYFISYLRLRKGPSEVVSQITDFIRPGSNKKVEANNESLGSLEYSKIVKIASWDLSNRYWNHGVELGIKYHNLNWRIGVEFDSLIDLIFFKTPDYGWVNPRDLDQAIQKKDKELPSVDFIDYSIYEVPSHNTLVEALLKAYPIALR
jgi:hypothetical protein